MVLGTDMTNHYNFGVQIYFEKIVIFCSLASERSLMPTCVHHFLRHLSEIKEQTADPTRLDRIQVLTFILHACDICHPGPGYHLRITTTYTLTSNIFCARTFLKIVC